MPNQETQLTVLNVQLSLVTLLKKTCVQNVTEINFQINNQINNNNQYNNNNNNSLSNKLKISRNKNNKK
jgi:hypothetical protein